MAENSESKEPAAGAGKDVGKDKVGDILRKERLTRRITIETIAKDLKLNVGYIKALEASDYDSLPPDPYIRVYIRSLTKYLSLNADNILLEFYKERGLIADDTVQNQAGKIDVSVRQQDKNPTVIIIAALIVVLAVFAFIANQKGWMGDPQETAVPSLEDKPDTSGIAAADHDAESERKADSTQLAQEENRRKADSAAAAIEKAQQQARINRPKVVKPPTTPLTPPPTPGP